MGRVYVKGTLVMGLEGEAATRYNNCVERLMNVERDVMVHLAKRGSVVGYKEYCDWFRELQRMVVLQERRWEAFNGYFAAYTQKARKGDALKAFRYTLERTRDWEEMDEVFPVLYWGGAWVGGIKAGKGYLLTRLLEKGEWVEIDNVEDAWVLGTWQNAHLDDKGINGNVTLKQVLAVEGLIV